MLNSITSFLKKVILKLKVVVELFGFFWKKRMWWLLPALALLLLLYIFVIFSQSSGIAPLIYTLF